MQSEDQESDSDYVSKFIEQTAAITGLVVGPYQSYQGESPLKNKIVDRVTNKSANKQRSSLEANPQNKIKLKFDDAKRARIKNIEKSNSLASSNLSFILF